MLAESKGELSSIKSLLSEFQTEDVAFLRSETCGVASAIRSNVDVIDHAR